ncbi:hypothetical protein ACKI1J_15500 [Streptomyces scabiei]|uniref:hypothetical protein n=1 Tax=Streptomyces scabiei TaxID=1930 RepID=UPI0038F6BE90
MNGPAFLRRALNAAASRTQQAYRDYVAHCTACPECEGTSRCASADDLWQAYLALRDSDDAARPRKSRA